MVANYSTDARNILNVEAYQRMLSMNPENQYKRVIVAPYLEKALGIKFTKSLKKQVSNVEHTPFAWIDNEDDL